MADNTDQYVVIAPLACVKDKSGKLHYLYYGSPVVVDMTDEDRQRYIDRGLIAKSIESETDQPGEIQVSLINPSDVLSAPVATTPTEELAEPEVTEPPEQIERPATVAPKEAWEDYAVKRGMSRERAESLSKRQIQDTYPLA